MRELEEIRRMQQTLDNEHFERTQRFLWWCACVAAGALAVGALALALAVA